MMSFLLITQDPEWSSHIRDEVAKELGESATTDKVESPTLEDTLAVIEHADPAVVVVGPDIASGIGLFLARALDERAPDTTVVLVADPTPQLLERAVRAGVRDVIDPLAEDDFVYMALEDALERATRRRSRIRTTATSEPARAKVVTVVSPKGGAGKTVTTTNIAVGLGRVAPNEVVVVDLDVQFGDVANALRLTPETTIADVARSAAVDATTVKAFLTPHPGNFFVLCAPETPAEADMLKPELVGETIDLLAQMFRFVVIDTAAGLDEMTLTAIEHSTDLVVMCATDVSSARGLRKELDAFEILGFTTQRRHFALNRSDARVGLDAEDIKSTVGLDVAVSIPSSRMVPTALNQGTPVLELEQRSPVARAFADLVAQVADLSTSPQPVATGGGLFRRVKEMR